MLTHQTADEAFPTDGIRIGGLLRCCIATIEELYPDGPARIGVEGQLLQCNHHTEVVAPMRFRNGAWEWNHD